MDWFAENTIQDISIYVAVGNEDAISFYSKHQFYPRVTKLVKKPEFNRIVPKLYSEYYHSQNQIHTYFDKIFERENILANQLTTKADKYITKDFTEYCSSGKIVNHDDIVSHFSSCLLVYVIYAGLV